MKKKVSILIFSTLIIFIAGIGIVKFSNKGTDLGVVDQRPNQESVEDLKEDTKGEDNTNLEQNLQTEEDKVREKLIRIDEQGEVAVGITFLNPIEDHDDFLTFEVILDTHTIELEQYNLEDMTTLSIGDELKITEGILWEIEGEGHHMIGYLKIPKSYEGALVDYLESDFLELEIKNLNEITSRKFRWEKSQLQL